MRPFQGRAAIFDVDDSLLAGNAGTLFTWWLLQKGICDTRWRAELPRAAVAYARKQVGEEAMIRLATSCHEGIPAAALMRAARDCHRELLHRRITEAGRAQLRRHLTAGHLVIVASGSPEAIVREVARDVHAHLAIGTTGGITGGLCTGVVTRGPTFRVGKRDAVLPVLEAYGIDPADAALYSDSAADLPLFEAVGQPVVIDPKPAFREEAERRGWEIRRWRVPDAARVDADAWEPWEG